MAKPKTPRKDLNERAAEIVRALTDPDSKPAAPTTPIEQPPVADGRNPAAVALGKLGGAKGGPARAKALTPERRKEIATKAVQTRWDKKRKP